MRTLFRKPEPRTITVFFSESIYTLGLLKIISVWIVDIVRSYFVSKFEVFFSFPLLYPENFKTQNSKLGA